MITIRKVLTAIAFSATVAATLTGFALSGESTEIKTVASCAAADWPMIPAECLEGTPARNVRYVSANVANSTMNMQERSEAAFQ